jgi:hypothetical protein
MSTDTKGKAKALYFGSVMPMVGHSVQPDWSFLYETSLIQDSNWWVGDKVVLPDGREFVYAKSSAAIATNFGCNFTAAGYVAQTVVTVADAIGSKVLHVPAATHAALTKDELRGGYVIIGNQNGGTTPAVRGIVGNDASILNVAFVVYLDAPLSVATVVSTTGVEVYQNPFAAIGQSDTVVLPRAGIAATGVSAANTYFWVQTKGVGYTSPQPSVGADNGGITAMWRHDGSVVPMETALGATVPAMDVAQIAGIALEGSTTGNGPLLLLK